MSRRYYNNSDNEDSFEKEYLNIFKNDFLDDDDADDDYNVVEDILTHKYNYDEKPYYLSIPKKEVNDVINDANLQDNLDIFSDKDNEYKFLSRKTNRNKDIKENKNNINTNKQSSNLSYNEQLSIIENNSNNILLNNNSKHNLNISGISNIKEKMTDHNDNINISNMKTKLNNNKLYGNNNIFLKEQSKSKKGINKEYNKNKNIKYNDHINKNYNIISEPLNNNLTEGNNLNNLYNNNRNNNNIIVNSSNNNNYNDMRYDYYSKIKDLNQNKGLAQMDLIEKLLFLLKQYDLMLQLLIQNLMMTENKNLKFRCYTLLFSFYMAKQRVIENLKFPEFYVSFEFNDIFGEGNNINYNYGNKFNYNNINNKFQRLRLQLSFFQPPILEILPILVKFIIKRTFTREETIKILKDFFPFTNPLYFPISKKFRHSTYIPTINNINNDNNNVNNNEVQNPGKKKMRKKFNYVDDSLLLLGIYFHGKKNYEIIKQLWLPQRSTEEIKHRIKNLVCQNAPLNIIKKYKTMNEKPLNQKDFLKFLKGIEWFGLKNKWNLISRYFLPEKTSDYLENFFELLIEKNVLPADLTNNNKSNVTKYKNGNLKKVHIFIDDDVVKMYKETFKDEISMIKSEITNMKSKTIFYSDVEYEKIDKAYFTRNKDDARINTRNKSKKLLNVNNNLNEGGNSNNNNEKNGPNSNTDEKKGINHEENKNNGNKKNTKDNINNNIISNDDWEFQMNFLDNELFEKITI